MCLAAAINIYFGINIDKKVLCSWALLPPPSVLQLSVLGAGGHQLTSASVPRASERLGRPPAHLCLNGHSNSDRHTAK